MVQCMVKGALLLTIFFGANDCALLDGTSNRQHIPLAQYKANLESMVALARTARIENILLITPPPIDEVARVAHNKRMHGDNAKDTAERTNAVAGEYAAACKEVCQLSRCFYHDCARALEAQCRGCRVLLCGLGKLCSAAFDGCGCSEASS